jgi:hypothetical protein
VRAGEQRRRVLRVDEENEAQPPSVNRFHHAVVRRHDEALTVWPYTDEVPVGLSMLLREGVVQRVHPLDPLGGLKGEEQVNFVGWAHGSFNVGRPALEDASAAGIPQRSPSWQDDRRTIHVVRAKYWRNAFRAGVFAGLAAACSPDQMAGSDASTESAAGACPDNAPAPPLGVSGGACSDPGLSCRYGCPFSPYEECICTGGTFFCPVQSDPEGCLWAQAMGAPREGDDCSYGCDAGSFEGEQCTFACPGDAGDRLSALCQTSPQQASAPRWHVEISCPGSEADVDAAGDGGGTDAGSD